MSEKIFDQNITPVHYKIHFVPKEDSFKGQEIIALNITAATSKITLHAKGIELHRASLHYQGRSFSPAEIIPNEKNETVTLNFAESFFPGNAELSMDFSGDYRNVDGLYVSSYTHDGQQKRLLSTQFEATYARTAFPCFDHPAAKATFQVDLTLDKHLQAISNTPIEEEIVLGLDKKLVTFHTTPRMSTYLLYLGAGEFETVEDSYRNVNLRVLTTPGKAGKGRFALDVTKKVLGYFEKFFGIEYPLSKLDLIAVPDFGAGAMENWGAITFREDALLYDPERSSLANKQRVAEVVAHELAHQWFGNLVTMKWWDDLWLNESFATYMSFKAVDHFFPELDLWSTFLNLETDRAFTLDALSSSHPIHVPVKTAHQIEEIFDAISYSKGGSVLRMLEAYVGEDSFRSGLRSYLAEYSYGNAEADDLWRHIQAASPGKAAEKVMGKWLHQTGFPMVDVAVRGAKVTLEQKRFAYTDAEEATVWPVPLTFITPDGSLDGILFEEKNGSMAIPRKLSWLKVNAGQKGFYRLRYDKKTLKRLEKAIQEKELPEADRWGVHNDQSTLCLAGEVNLGQYLDFTGAYADEDSHLVLTDLLDNLNYFSLLATNEKFLSLIQDRKRELCGRLLKNLGWAPREGEQPTVMQTRSSVISSVGD